MNCYLTVALGLALECVMLTYNAVCAQTSSLCTSPSSQYGYINISRISEDVPTGTVLWRLDLVGSDADVLISLQPTEWAIQLIDRILVVTDRLEVLSDEPLDQITFSLDLDCTIRSSGLKIVTTVIVTVYDTNDHSPFFVNAPYIVNVSESTPIGTPIFELSANDLDPSDSGYLGFSVAPALGNSTFAQNFAFRVATVGTLYLVRQLDYQQAQIINVAVVVEDNINNHTVLGKVQPRHNSSTFITIFVIPTVEDNPRFNHSTYTAIISKNMSTNSAISLFPSDISAIYPFYNSPIVYSIVNDNTTSSTDDGQYFAINATTGQISVSSYINTSLSSQLAFLVTATASDKVERYSRALVKVKVSDIIDDTGSSSNASESKSLIAGIAVIAVIAFLLLVVVIALAVIISRRTERGFYAVKRDRANRPQTLPSTERTPVPPPLPSNPPPTSLPRAVNTMSGSNKEVSADAARTSNKPAQQTFRRGTGDTSVQESPFDVDVYMLQQSRDQHDDVAEGRLRDGGTLAFKTSPDAPPKPVRTPNSMRRSEALTNESTTTERSIDNVVSRSQGLSAAEKQDITIYY